MAPLGIAERAARLVLWRHAHRPMLLQWRMKKQRRVLEDGHPLKRRRAAVARLHAALDGIQGLALRSVLEVGFCPVCRQTAGAGQGSGSGAANAADSTSGARGIMQRSAGVASAARLVRCAGLCNDPESEVSKTYFCGPNL